MNTTTHERSIEALESDRLAAVNRKRDERQRDRAARGAVADTDGKFLPNLGETIRRQEEQAATRDHVQRTSSQIEKAGTLGRDSLTRATREVPTVREMCDDTKSAGTVPPFVGGTFKTRDGKRATVGRYSPELLPCFHPFIGEIEGEHKTWTAGGKYIEGDPAPHHSDLVALWDEKRLGDIVRLDLPRQAYDDLLDLLEQHQTTANAANFKQCGCPLCKILGVLTFSLYTKAKG